MISGLLAVLVATSAASAHDGPHDVTSSNVPSGGPVILGGDDTPDHGSADYNTDPPTLQSGRIYMKAAVTSELPRITKVNNDGGIAVVGSCDKGTAQPVRGDVHGAYKVIANQLGGSHPVTTSKVTAAT